MIEFTLLVRVLLHLVTALAVMSYVSECRSRPGSSLIAVMIAGASVAGAFDGVRAIAQQTAQLDIWLTVFVAAIALSTILNGGNVAKMFRRPYGR